MEKDKSITTTLTISMGFLVVYFLTQNSFFIKLSLLIGILSLISSQLAKNIELLWMKLTWILSKIVPNLVLSLLFFLFITPIAIASRIFTKKDPLKLKDKANSLFEDYNKKIDSSFFKKTW
jgi:hypothetical protein